MEVPEDLGTVKTGVLKTPFTECWKSFPEDENEGSYFSSTWEVLFVFRADKNVVNLHKTRVLFFFRIEVLFFFRADKMRGAI